MSDTKYCYPDSDVLINKLDIKDKDKLQKFERKFIRSLVLKNGYVIRFDRISEEEIIRASQESFLCNYDYMEKLFAKCINKM